MIFFGKLCFRKLKKCVWECPGSEISPSENKASNRNIGRRKNQLIFKSRMTNII